LRGANCSDIAAWAATDDEEVVVLDICHEKGLQVQ
jgi:hypothetical protein